MTELVRAGNESTNIAWLPKAINKQAATLPPHLFKLPGRDWAVWRWMALRGAGFPASEVLKLAAPECAAAADALFEVEAELEAVRAQAMGMIKSELAKADARQGSALAKTLRRLEKGKLPQAIEGVGELQAVLT